ncbi:hypothetical protein F8388_018265 [Cannabis sativa]|uniref:Uncharacterized protein n=1 Tax=Cannabis sativa TaxID=3483 RepID=A0A7J6EJ46_CANSA|nr:hypothetical protein F8388_018265 [Cannabis sativa]
MSIKQPCDFAYEFGNDQFDFYECLQDFLRPGGNDEYRTSFTEREARTIKKSKTG